MKKKKVLEVKRYLYLNDSEAILMWISVKESKKLFHRAHRYFDRFDIIDGETGEVLMSHSKMKRL